MYVAAAVHTWQVVVSLIYAILSVLSLVVVTNIFQKLKRDPDFATAPEASALKAGMAVAVSTAVD